MACATAVLRRSVSWRVQQPRRNGVQLFNPGEDDGVGVNRLHGRATFDRNLRGPGDLLYVPRIASSFEVTDTQTLVAGLSAAFGRTTPVRIITLRFTERTFIGNGNRPTRTADFRSSRGKLNFFTAATKPALTPSRPRRCLQKHSKIGAFTRKFCGASNRVGSPGCEAITWTGITARSTRWTSFADDASVYHPLDVLSERILQVPLQYNFDHGENFGDEHSVWMQVEFLLGAHGAHKF